MNTLDIKERLVQFTVANSGYQQLAYLGMSRMAECPLALYRQLAQPADDRRPGWLEHLKYYAGHLWKADVKARLQAVGLYIPGSECELVAPFDQRFRGHTDGMIDGHVLIIHSTHSDQLYRIRTERRVPRLYFYQAQCYLRYSHQACADMVFVARDSGELWVMSIDCLEDVGRKLEDKALRVLAAVDAGQPPACECDRCR